MPKPSRAVVATALVGVGVVGVALFLARPGSSGRADADRPGTGPVITLDVVSEAIPAEPVRLAGELLHADPSETTVVLQRRSATGWVTVAHDPGLQDDSYGFLHQFGRATGRSPSRPPGRSRCCPPPARARKCCPTSAHAS